MSETPTDDRDPRPPPANERARRARPRWHRIALAVPAVIAGVIAVLVIGGYAFLATDAGVAFAVHELELRSGGRLQVEGATGSLVSEMHVRRVAWRGVSSRLAANDVVLTWSPLAFLSHGIVVRSLGAQRVDLDIEPSDTDAPPPATLALPFDVTIEHLAITRLDWQVGPNAGTILGIALSYDGGAKVHRITNVALGTEAWKLEGDASIGANAPFVIAGALALEGQEPHEDAQAKLALSGTLAALAIEGSGTMNRARFDARAEVAPLAAVPLHDLALDAADVDLAAWSRGLPTTRLQVVARTEQTRQGLAGNVSATNETPGSIDAGRVPVRTLAAQFAWRGDAIDLEGLNAEIAGGGRARGSAHIPLGAASGAGVWSLDVAGVDLHAIYAPLVSTRLAGKIAAELDPDRQKFSGDVTEGVHAAGIALRFAATVDENAVVLEQFRASAAAGELAGRARVGRNDPRPFMLDATARRFDPSRFGAYPAGAVDGRIHASGALVPSWRVDADVAIDKGSQLAGVALGGTIRGSVAADGVRDADVALEAGSAKLTARGSAGRPDDLLAVTLDAPRLADLLPLVPGAASQRLAGALSAKARWHGAFRGGGIDVTAKGSGLTLGADYKVASFDLDFSIAPARGDRDDLAARALKLDARVRDLAVPQGRFSTAHTELAGTLAQHQLSLALAASDITVDAAAHGGFVAFDASAPPSEWRWNGVIERLTGSGPLSARLLAPAAVNIGYERVHVSDARFAVADGTMRVSELTWEQGRITTSGALNGVPLATVARIANVPLPFESTLTLAGEWSVAATPRLTGTANLHREGGDLSLKGDASTTAANLALGLTALEVNAKFANDAVDATGTLASTRGGNANAKLTIGAAPNAPPGRITADAPLSLDANAELPTLALLQPWIGTTAVVDGRLRADARVRGTVGRMLPSGTLTADALRVDAPQYGVHYTDGRLRAHLADRTVVLDEVVLHAGDGEFHASGTVSSITEIDGETAAAIGWRATRFRLLNRPELHLVVDGEGKLGLAQGKFELQGKLRAEEGRVVYTADPAAALGNDVVVKGWTKPASPALRAADVPLVVDLNLDFGDRFAFASEGLETGVEGTVRVTTGPRGFVGKGSLRAVNGTYRAFGQRLVIDPGRLIFDGPLDNPGLDIVALRRNLAVEAGVMVSGTVRVPIIQLTSNPPVSDSEKLSWLVLGHGLERTSGTDYSALQTASAMLLGRNNKSITQSIAERIGIDDIELKQAQTSSRSGQTDTQGQVVAIGKRLSDNLTLIYEQGITAATTALKIQYALTRNLTVSAETGLVSGVGLQYHHSFE